MRGLVTNRLAVLMLSMGALRADGADGQDEFIHLMNVGKAQLENRSAAAAVETFSEAVRLQSGSAAGWRNLARANLAAGHPEAALDALSRARSLSADDVAVSYLSGLAHVHLAQAEAAVPYFEAAVRLDPNTATLRYQLAGAYQAADQRSKAAEQLRETVRLDPLHAAAHYKLANLARQDGDEAAFQQHHLEFLRLRKLFGDETRTADLLERCVYTQAEAPEASAGRPAPESAPAPIGVRFADGTKEPLGDIDPSAAAAAVLDVDEEGRSTIFIADKSGEAALLSFAGGKAARRKPDLKVPGGSFAGCIAGDFYDDVPEGVRYDPKIHGMNDVLLLGREGACLLQRVAPTEFRDVTTEAGLKDVRGEAAAWVDYDHDGDLDLAVGGADGIELWQNNGHARFTNVTRQVGIDATGRVTDIAAVDLDANNAVDLVVARDDEPTLVFQNQRAGRFAKMAEPPGPWPAARRVLMNDLDNNGHVDALLLGDREALALYGRSTRRERVDLGDLRPSAAALIDYDNDGWLDVAVAGTLSAAADRGSVRIWRNGRDGTWTEASQSLGLSDLPMPAVRQLLVVDADSDGDSDLLLITGENKLRWLRNDGGERNGQLKLRLAGTKTNPSGIGTHVELRDGPFWVSRAITGIPIELGLAGHRQLDSLQTVWTNGIVDNQISVSPIPPVITVVEKNVAAGSCPFLWVWDGERRRFVTDLLGNAPLGLSLRRDVLLPADPDEYVWIGDSDEFRPRDGSYVAEVADCFREVAYLDQVRLVAVDHPPEIEVHPTDKLMPPPFPASELWPLAMVAELRAVESSDGLDRIAALRRVDDDYAPPGAPLPPPLRGMCRPLTLTLDFGPLDAARPLVLALTGWLQYGDASTNIALAQDAQLTIVPPRLEAETAKEWMPLDVVVGMPAGKTKTILCDLSGKLPDGARRLRLTTTFEVRWDRIALLERRPASLLQVRELPPTAADLHWFGFPKLSARTPGHPTTPDETHISDQPPWRTTLEGWCTRYGDVLELLQERDGKLALLNSGDGVSLRFDAAALPDVPRGCVRTFFFYSVGWDKDADPNVVTGDTVEPLPGESQTAGSEAPDSESDWRLHYNARWVPAARFAPPPLPSRPNL